jgi:gamma-glutamylcyclotransferase (GGCT)/AIG2-like uncharacterized protein YtfP
VENATYLGESFTRDPYVMVDLGYFPGVMLLDGAEQGRIQGEVYEVDDVTFRMLDKLEGNGRMYQRARVDILKFGKCWMYFFLGSGDSRSRLLRNQILPNDDGIVSWKDLTKDPLEEMGLYEEEDAEWGNLLLPP